MKVHVFYFIGLGNVKLLKELIHHMNINIGDKHGYTPLHLAAVIGNQIIVDFLFENGANASATDSSGRSPLHWVVLSGNIQSSNQ